MEWAGRRPGDKASVGVGAGQRGRRADSTGPGGERRSRGASLGWWCCIADEPLAPVPLSFNRVESMQVDLTPSPARKVSTPAPWVPPRPAYGVCGFRSSRKHKHSRPQGRITAGSLRPVLGGDVVREAGPG